MQSKLVPDKRHPKKCLRKLIPHQKILCLMTIWLLVRGIFWRRISWRRTNDKWPFCHTRVFCQSISGFGLQTLSKIDLDFTFANPKFCLPFRFSCLVDWRPRMYNGLVGHRQIARCVIKSKTVVVVYSMLLNICYPKPYGHPLGLLNSQNTGICSLHISRLKYKFGMVWAKETDTQTRFL